MARNQPSEWLVDETTHGSVRVSIDVDNADTVVITQDDAIVWVAPEDVDDLIAVLRQAKATAEQR